MKNIFLNQIFTAIALGLTGVLVSIIKSLGNVAIDYIANKKQVLEKTLQLDKHKEEIETAKTIWNIVEEKYRITTNITDLAKSKSEAFNKMLLRKMPYLTQQEISDIRQAIAGEFNKGKALLNDENIKIQAKELLEKNNKLEEENKSLQNKLNSISSAVLPVGQGQ